jgi:hypothetical protein
MMILRASAHEVRFDPSGIDGSEGTAGPMSAIDVRMIIFATNIQNILMGDSYPQFGASDYGGFTTEEEIARRMATMTSMRGSPAIGVRAEETREPSAPAPAEPVAATARQESRSPAGRSVTDALYQLCRSRPESVVDWVIIFIIVIAIVCFFEYAPDIFARVIYGSGMHMRGGGHTRAVDHSNFCAECGGVMSA